MSGSTDIRCRYDNNAEGRRIRVEICSYTGLYDIDVLMTLMKLMGINLGYRANRPSCTISVSLSQSPISLAAHPADEFVGTSNRGAANSFWSAVWFLCQCCSYMNVKSDQKRFAEVPQDCSHGDAHPKTVDRHTHTYLCRKPRECSLTGAALLMCSLSLSDLCLRSLEENGSICFVHNEIEKGMVDDDVQRRSRGRGTTSLMVSYRRYRYRTLRATSIIAKWQRISTCSSTMILTL